MKNVFRLLSIAVIVAVIGFSMAACDDGTKDGSGTSRFNTTDLAAAIMDAVNAKYEVETAANAVDVPIGKKWVTEAEWNALDTAYKAAGEARANPSSQSAVDTAKANLHAAIAVFNTAKKEGTGSAITIGGTITVKKNGQLVPYVQIQAYNDDWSWEENKRVHLTGVNTQWSIITKPFSSSTTISFRINGYDNDKYENAIFGGVNATATATVYQGDVTNIAINIDSDFITISGTLNINYGKVIPSVAIEIYKKDDRTYLGYVDIINVGNNASWSTMIPAQTSNTDIVFSIIGFDGPLPWEYDQLFSLWNKDFGVNVGNKNKSGIALNLITISGTVNIAAYKGKPVPVVYINISTILGGESVWLAGTELKSPAANTPWSFVMPSFTSDTEIEVSVGGEDEDGSALFWTDVTKRTVKNSSVSGIAINIITVSGTVSITYNGEKIPIVEIHMKKAEDDSVFLGAKDLYSPDNNSPWVIFIPAFTSNTGIVFDVFGFTDDTWDSQLIGYRPSTTVTVRNTNVTGVVLNLGDFPK